MMMMKRVMKSMMLGLAVAAFVAGCDLLGGGAEDTPEKPSNQTETVATPTASPGAGAVAAGQPVTLSTATKGATIYYTVDGTTPTAASPVYATPIAINGPVTVKAYATKSGMTASATLAAAYFIDNTLAAAPVASRETGTYSTALSVTLATATIGGSIHYTVNGDSPTASSTPYTGAIAIAATTTLKAVTVSAGLKNSPVMERVYTLKPATPAASQPGGNYTATRNVELATATAGATIHYTVNGSDPTASSTLYTGAIPVGAGTTTLKAVALKTGWTPSDTLTVTYTVTLPPLPPDPLPPAPAEPEDYFTVENNGPGVTITAYTGVAADLVIPGTIKGRPVTVIGDNVFKNKVLYSVYIPGSVTEIGSHAFEGNQLTSVHIPQATAALGYNAFAFNPFTRITVGSNVDIEVIWEAFSAEGFYSVYRNAGTYTLGSVWAKGIQIQTEEYWYTESGGKATLTGYTGNGPAVAIPGTLGGNQVTAIGQYVFEGKQLTGVTIPSGVTTINYRAFDNNLLTSVVIPSSVTFLSGFGNNQISSVIIPSSVTTINSEAFENNQLTSVIIPDSVIRLSGFRGNQLTSVIIPDSVTEIRGRAFSDNQLTSVTIPSGVTYLEGFSNNQLTSVTIGNSVTTIGSSAFEGNKLASVTIPNSVTEIGSYAFEDNWLTSVTIGNGVTAIGDSAFYDNLLTSVTIPNGVTEIDSYAFRDNPLTSVTIGDKQAGTYTRITGSYYNWTKSSSSGGSGGSGGGSYSKPSKLSDNASYSDYLAKKAQIIAYCNARPGTANNAVKSGIEESFGDVTQTSWSIGAYALISMLNLYIDKLE